MKKTCWLWMDKQHENKNSHKPFQMGTEKRRPCFGGRVCVWFLVEGVVVILLGCWGLLWE